MTPRGVLFTFTLERACHNFDCRPVPRHDWASWKPPRVLCRHCGEPGAVMSDFPVRIVKFGEWKVISPG